MSVRTCSGSLTSQACPNTGPAPSPRSEATASSISLPLLELTITPTPSRTSDRATANPIPLVLPVTTARLPDRLIRTLLIAATSQSGISPLSVAAVDLDLPADRGAESRGLIDRGIVPRNLTGASSRATWGLLLESG